MWKCQNFSITQILREFWVIGKSWNFHTVSLGNTMLTHWTKKIILEEGHIGSQLVHILQLVVKHYKVYYPVRHHLIQNIVNSIQRLGFNATGKIFSKLKLSIVILNFPAKKLDAKSLENGTFLSVKWWLLDHFHIIQTSILGKFDTLKFDHIWIFPPKWLAIFY